MPFKATAVPGEVMEDEFLTVRCVRSAFNLFMLHAAASHVIAALAMGLSTGVGLVRAVLGCP